MPKQFILIILLSIGFSIKSISQENNPIPVWNDTLSLGIGSGNDYGDLGVNLLYYLKNNIGLFGGLGYAIAGLGYGIGIKVRFPSNKVVSRFTPYAIAMYGSNTTIWVITNGRYNKLFYGPTIGLGFDYRSKGLKRGYLTFSLQFPILSSKVQEYKDDLTKNHNIDFSTSIPIDISIGYRYIIN